MITLRMISPHIMPFRKLIIAHLRRYAESSPKIAIYACRSSLDEPARIKSAVPELEEIKGVELNSLPKKSAPAIRRQGRLRLVRGGGIKNLTEPRACR